MTSRATELGKPKFVVFIKENTGLNTRFPSMRRYGAHVSTDWEQWGRQPHLDPVHTRNAIGHWLQHQQDPIAYPFHGVHIQIKPGTTPFYDYLAATSLFHDNFFSAFAAQSTSGHQALIGGQCNTLGNPPFFGFTEDPEADMPTIFSLALKAGFSVGAFPDETNYPTKLYTELNQPDFYNNYVHQSHDFITMAREGNLPDLSYVWFNLGEDEHPMANLRRGERVLWKMVDAMVAGGGWDNTVVPIVFDDGGGFDDIVVPPHYETHPSSGIQVASGNRLPCLVLGGPVRPGVDHTLLTQLAVPKTIIDTWDLGLMGVTRLDTASSFADKIEMGERHQSPPPHYRHFARYGRLHMPEAPFDDNVPLTVLPTYSGPARPMDPIYLNDGTTLPPPAELFDPNSPPVQADPLHTWIELTLLRLAVEVEESAPSWLIRMLGAPREDDPSQPRNRFLTGGDPMARKRDAVLHPEHRGPAAAAHQLN